MSNDNICMPSYNRKCRISESKLNKKVNAVDAMKELLHQLRVSWKYYFIEYININYVNLEVEN